MRTKRKTSRVLAKLLSFVMALTFILSSAMTVSAAVDYDPEQVDYRSVMYYGDWSIWGGQGNHYPTTLPVENYTHLNFAFLDFDANGNLMFTDPDAAVVAPVGMNVTWGGANAGILSAFQDLRARNPHLRIGVSVGGWSKSGDFSAVTANPVTRAKFVQNLVDFVRYTNMDYLDVDWEYPCDVRQPDLVDNMRDEGTPNATPADKQNYILLLQDLRAALDAQGEELGKTYEMSIALPAPSARIALGYNLTALMDVLDFINIMTYDMSGAWNPVSGHHTALYTNPADPFINDGYSVDASVNYILDELRSDLESQQAANLGPSDTEAIMAEYAKKLVVGYALYTRGWERVDDDGGAVDSDEDLPGLFGTAHLVNRSANYELAYGAANLAPLVSGDGGHLSGVWSYGTIEQLKARYPGLQLIWDDIAHAHYLYNPDSGAFFTLDTVESVQAKAEYVKENGLGGLIGWMASQDKTTTTGKRDELSSTAREALFGNSTFAEYNISGAAISVSVSLSTYTANGRNGYNITITNTASTNESDSVVNAVEKQAETVKLPKIYIKTASGATFSTGGYPTGAVSNQDGVGIVDMSTVFDNQFLTPGKTTTFKVLTNGAAEISDILCICLSQRITPTGPEISKQCVYGSCEDDPIDPDPVDEEPVITGADDVTIEVGTPFDPMAGVSATDEEDGDLTSAIVVTGTVDVNTPGVYTLTYSVVDSAPNTVAVTRTVTVVPPEVIVNRPPVISGVSNKTITVGDSFDPMQGVTANDPEDGNLTSDIIVTGEVDTAVAGSYGLTYTVTDKDAVDPQTTSVSCVITVEEPVVVVPGNYDPDKAYVAGDTVEYDGETYRAKWWVRGGGTPDVNPAFEKITNNNNTIPAWNANQAYVAGDKVTYNGQTYEAQWWTRGNTPGTNSVWKLV